MNKLNQITKIRNELLSLISVAKEENDYDLEQVASLHFDFYSRTLNYEKKFGGKEVEVNKGENC